MRRLLVLLITILASVAQTRAAQPADTETLVAAGSVGGSTGSHGWTVIRAESIVPWALVHTPPRSASGTPGATAQDGVARIAAALGSQPSSMAAVGNRVYMAFEVDTIGSNGKRRVLSVRSVRSPASGLWVTEPLGRFDAVESLPAEGRLHEITGLIDGPLALMSFPVPGGESLSLRFLHTGRWIDVHAPPAASAPRFNMRWSAFAAGDGCVLVGRSGATLELWRTTRLFPTPDAAAPADPAESPADTGDDNPAPTLEPEWSERTMISVPPALQSEISADWSMVWHAEELVCGVHTGNSLRFVAWSADGGWRDVALLEGVPPRAAVFALRDCGRLVTMWTTPRKGESSGLMSGRVPLDREIREVSIATGKQMYSGPLRLVGPVSGSDYRYVMTALLMVSATVLLFVLRPDEAQAFQLPDGYSLAEAPRRLIASLIDFAAVFFAAWMLLGAEASDISSPSAWREYGAETFFYTLAATCILNTLLEGLTGFTLGKRVTGCRVVRGVDSSGDPATAPGIARALLRNAIKWGLPPLAVMGLIDPEGRGRGDQLARTAVAIETPDEEPPE